MRKGVIAVQEQKKLLVTWRQTCGEQGGLSIEVVGSTLSRRVGRCVHYSGDMTVE